MRVSANGRVSRSEAEWQEILSRFQSSGLSIKQYCDQVFNDNYNFRLTT
jgi:hypothetical protein